MPVFSDEQVEALNNWARTDPALHRWFPYLGPEDGLGDLLQRTLSMILKQSDDSASFGGIGTISFEVDNFYLTQNVGSTDEVQVNLRGGVGEQGEKGDTGDTGPAGPAGADGADGEDGIGFYGINVGQTDDNPTFKGIDTLKFEVANFYVTQQDLSTAIINFRGEGGGGSGEANTASNLAGDEGVFASKAGVDLRFKSLTAGSNISLSSDGNAITIASTASGGGGGFYGVLFEESEAGGYSERDDVLVVDSSYFYMQSNASAKPLLSFHEDNVDHDKLTNFTVDEHFTEASIDHTNIQNVGSNTHAQIDAQLAGIGPGFYGVLIKESEAGGYSQKDDELNFDSNYFYLQDNGSAKPLVSFTGLNANEVDYVDFYINSDNVEEALDSLRDQHVDAWEPTGFVNRTTSSISFSNPARIFTITPEGSKGFDIYVQGKKFTKTSAESVIISNTEGLHFVYYDRTGALKSITAANTSTRAMIHTTALASIIYWDATNQREIYVADERHGIVMSGATHYHFHDIWGCMWEKGLGLVDFTVDGDGDDNISAQFGYGDGEIHDEDLAFDIDDGPVPAAIPIYYKWGTDADWRRKEADPYPMIYSGTVGYTGPNGRLPYNQNDSGDWKLTEVTQADFVLVHYFATNDRFYGIIGVQGEADYNNLGQARTGAATEIGEITTAGMAFAEFTPVGSVIFQTRTTYDNTPMARVRATDTGDDYVDFRGQQFAGGSGASSDHGGLSGLADDDHAQYTLADGTRDFTGEQSMGSNKLTNLAQPTAANDAARLTDIPPGFYGVTFRESEAGGYVNKTDQLTFSSTHFYLTSDASGKAFVSLVAGAASTVSGTFASATEWEFNHSMNTDEVVWSTYDDGEEAFIPQRVDVSDPNTAYFYMAEATAGHAVLVGGEAGGGGSGGSGETYVKAMLLLNSETGTPTVRDSLNISSVTDNGVGDFTINFTAGTFADSDYFFVAKSVGDGADPTDCDENHDNKVRSSSQNRIYNWEEAPTATGFLKDSDYISMLWFHT